MISNQIKLQTRKEMLFFLPQKREWPFLKATTQDDEFEDFSGWINSSWQEWVLETVWPSLMILSALGGVVRYGCIRVGFITTPTTDFPSRDSASLGNPSPAKCAEFEAQKKVGLGYLSENNLTFHYFWMVFQYVDPFGFIPELGETPFLPIALRLCGIAKPGGKSPGLN